jgi:hypothetical protein
MDLTKVQKTPEAPANPVAVKPEEQATAKPAIVPEPVKYQHYTSARVSVRLITHTGGRITFTGYEFITRDKSIIEYLDTEIANGLVGIIKGALLTSDEADPVAAMKRKHIAEYLAEEEKKKVNAAKGIIPDMGNNKAPGAASINPTNTNQVAN